MAGEITYLQPPLEVNPSALLEVFNALLEAEVPGWVPRAGNLDERIGGALSQLIAQLNEAAASAATTVFRYFGANIASIPPHEAQYATARAKFVAIDALGHKIPAGTVIVFTNSSGSRVAFETLEEVEIKEASTESTGVTLRAVEPGTEANGASGKALEFQNPLSYVSEVELESESNGGVEEESDEEYLSRLRRELRALTPKPIVPRDFNTILLNVEHAEGIQVGRVYTARGFNATATLKEKGKLKKSTKKIEGLSEATTAQLAVGTKVTGEEIKASTYITAVEAKAVVINTEPEEEVEKEVTFTGLASQPGCVSSWVTGKTGTALSEADMKVLEKEIEEDLLAGVEYRVAAPIYTKVKVVATVYAYTGQSTSRVKEAIEAAIKSYFSDERWGAPPTGESREIANDPIVRFDTLYKVILDVLGTHYVSSLEVNGGTGNVVLPGVVGFPELEPFGSGSTITVDTG